ncbi:hypothetical protein SCLCIDRAFT_1027108 [Scleroderma citrinum Foug A]|uniref:Uncharacterized protein n=1 Tax=Scleroderma citrinum Foug A TaxID=1036808 RepID=A0A0C2ZBT0_9AGAM|nr:hypothetical protein SCLCIDRAFT_1027108 [Scleroderma citrinum Foug A]
MISPGTLSSLDWTHGPNLPVSSLSVPRKLCVGRAIHIRTHARPIAMISRTEGLQSLYTNIYMASQLEHGVDIFSCEWYGNLQALETMY